MDKTTKKSLEAGCPICEGEVHRIKHVKAVKGENGAWKFRTQNVAVCKCNEKDIYI